ncbi:neogenin-like [Hydractinia symbiolongicarpus]|uniref:neogenin-like n=1 Tax=Hydractinia symbiolongicarpus TaxID=13093 RepID=UPI00254D7787|nr:neogenin-like [Hydractinia symbiolongicarpus]
MEIAPIITKYGPASLFLKKGSTGYLNCTLSPLTSTATVKWTKDQVEINIANDPRFATNKFNDLIILNAQSGAQSSEGNYRCSATNSVNTTTNEYDLVVKVTVLEREFLYAPRDTFFYDIDGKRLAWTNCQPPIAVPLAKVTFINGSSGLAVTSQTDARVEIREISREGSPFYQLLIQDATKYDVGTWQCRAKNRIGTRSANFKVTFYGPPEGAKGMRVKEHRLNGFIMTWDFLRVDIDYYDITITKIATNKVQTFKLDDAENFDRQILEYQFYNLERGTEYDVQMRATSKEKQVGEWSEKLRVKTVTEIAPVVTEQPGDANVGEGQTYNMSCVVDASPAATFRWFKNGIVISPTDSRYTIIDNKLIILNALHGAENSEAKYKCEASNNLGKATSEEAQLTVQWMEQNFQIAPRNRLFYRGTSFIRISARAPIGSSLHVTWRQNGVPIRPETHPNFAVTQYRGPANNLHYALDIRNLDERVDGKYTVSASNLGGIRSVEFHMILAVAYNLFREQFFQETRQQ